MLSFPAHLRYHGSKKRGAIMAYYNPYINPMQYNNPYMDRLNAMSAQGQMNTQPSQIIRVNGLPGAQAYQMGANASVALFDANEDYFYIKSTDGAGFASIRRLTMRGSTQSALSSTRMNVLNLPRHFTTSQPTNCDTWRCYTQKSWVSSRSTAQNTESRQQRCRPYTTICTTSR